MRKKIQVGKKGEFEPLTLSPTFFYPYGGLFLMSKEHNVLFTKAVNFRFCGLFSIDGVLPTASPDLLQAAKAHKKGQSALFSWDRNVPVPIAWQASAERGALLFPTPPLIPRMVRMTSHSMQLWN